MYFLTYNSFVLLLIVTDGFKIQGTYYEKYGILIEPSSYATHPLNFAYFTYNILFDHPLMNIKGVDRCNNTNSYSDKLDVYTRNYYNEVKELLTSTNPLNNLPICKKKHAFCINEEDNSIESNPYLIKRSKRFIPFIALAAGISALGLSFYNTFSQSQINDAVNNLNNNQQKILAQLNEQNHQINTLIDTDRVIYTKLESFEKALDHLISADICNIKSEIGYMYFLSKIQELHSKYERIINMVFLGKLSSDIVDPLSLRHMLQSHHQLKNSVLSDDVTLAYRLTQLIPLGVVNQHMGISILLRIPVIEIQDISPIFSITNVGWYHKSHYERFDLPKEFYLLLEQDTIFALEIDSESCYQSSNLWICDHAFHKTNTKTSCVNSIINGNENIQADCHIEATRDQNKEVVETRSGLLISGKHDVSLLKNIRSKLTANSIISHQIKNFTYFPYGGDISYSVDGIIYNSVQNPTTIHINPIVFNYFSELEDIPENLDNDDWKNLGDLKKLTEKLEKTKHDDLILQFPILLTASSCITLTITMVIILGTCWWCIKRRCNSKTKKVTEVGNMRSLLVKDDLH